MEGQKPGKDYSLTGHKEDFDFKALERLSKAGLELGAEIWAHVVLRAVRAN